MKPLIQLVKLNWMKWRSSSDLGNKELSKVEQFEVSLCLIANFSREVRSLSKKVCQVRCKERHVNRCGMLSCSWRQRGQAQSLKITPKRSVRMWAVGSISFMSLTRKVQCRCCEKEMHRCCDVRCKAAHV